MKLILKVFTKDVAPKLGDWFSISVNPNEEIRVNEAQTAWIECQEFGNHGKTSHLFRYIGIKDGKMQFLGEPIELRLCLYGREGAKNTSPIINNLCKKLMGEDENIKVRSIRKDDWEQLPWNLQYGNYLLDTEKKNEIFASCHNGFYSVQSGSLFQEYIWTTYGKEYSIIVQGIRPIANISLETKSVRIMMDDKHKGKKNYPYEIIK